MTDSRILAPIAALLIAQASFCGDKEKKEDEARAALELAKAKPPKADKEAFKDLETAKGMARLTGKDCVLCRYGDFDCLGCCTKARNAVRCSLPKDGGKERLRVMVFNAADNSWYYEDVERKPSSPAEVEGVVSKLRERLGVKARGEAAAIDWEL